MNIFQDTYWNHLELFWVLNHTRGITGILPEGEKLFWVSKGRGRGGKAEPWKDPNTHFLNTGVNYPYSPTPILDARRSCQVVFTPCLDFKSISYTQLIKWGICLEIYFFANNNHFWSTYVSGVNNQILCFNFNNICLDKAKINSNIL